MRWLRYTHDGETRYGLLNGDDIEEGQGDPFGGFDKTGRRVARRSVKIEIPLLPRTFYVAGQNYVEHAKNYPGGTGSGSPLASRPDVGYRARSGLIAHDEPVVIPFDATEQIHYEGELVVVIGKRGKRIPPDKAQEYVLGYTIGNDVSERSWQRQDKTAWRAKNADTFSPMGPWIETEFDLGKAQTIVRLNGKEQIRFSTASMIFGIETYLSATSQYVTLEPGDMFWMGTEGTSPNLKDGDQVDVEITGIGVLSNRFVREKAPEAD